MIFYIYFHWPNNLFFASSGSLAQVNLRTASDTVKSNSSVQSSPVQSSPVQYNAAFKVFISFSQSKPLFTIRLIIFCSSWMNWQKKKKALRAVWAPTATAPPTFTNSHQIIFDGVCQTPNSQFPSFFLLGEAESCSCSGRTVRKISHLTFLLVGGFLFPLVERVEDEGEGSWKSFRE